MGSALTLPVAEDMLGYMVLASWARQGDSPKTPGHYIRRLVRLSRKRIKNLLSLNGLTFGESLSSLWAVTWGIWVAWPFMDTFDTHSYSPERIYLDVDELTWGLTVFFLGLGQWIGAVGSYLYLRCLSAALLFCVWAWLGGCFWWRMPGSLENLLYGVLALSQATGYYWLRKRFHQIASGRPSSS